MITKKVVVLLETRGKWAPPDSEAVRASLLLYRLNQLQEPPTQQGRGRREPGREAERNEGEKSGGKKVVLRKRQGEK